MEYLVEVIDEGCNNDYLLILFGSGVYIIRDVFDGSRDGLSSNVSGFGCGGDVNCFIYSFGV